MRLKRNKISFIVFTVMLGLIVGAFSVVSDNIPDLRDGVTISEFFVSYLAIMINSLPIWFILAMLVGYIFANDIKEAVFSGAIYTVTAITFYFLIGYFYELMPVQISFKEQIIIYLTWYGASAIGGILGGVVGFFVKKSHFVLLILLLGLILQLVVNGTWSWNDIVGVSQNITYCIMIVGIMLFVILKRISQLKKDKDQ
jgi:hypothetical protein